MEEHVTAMLYPKPLDGMEIMTSLFFLAIRGSVAVGAISMVLAPAPSTLTDSTVTSPTTDLGARF